MRAIVIATGVPSPLSCLGSRYPTPMLPVVDRPVLQHVVEALVIAGIREIDFILSDAPEIVERHFSTGQRWGCRIHSHLASSAERALGMLPAIAGAPGEPYLLAAGDRLPLLPAEFPVLAPDACALLFDAPDGEWLGWAILTPSAVQSAVAAEGKDGFARVLRAQGAASFICERFLDTTVPLLYLQSQSAAMGPHSSRLQISAPEIEPGVRLGRNVSLHPTAQIHAPVFVGENCQIGRGVRLGPGAIVGAGTLVDEHSSIVQSVILPGSYIGQSLDLDHTVVNRQRLFNVRLDAPLMVTDAFILGDLRRATMKTGVSAALSRCLGLMLLAGLSQMLILAVLVRFLSGRGPTVHACEAVLLPVPEEGSWPLFRQWLLLPRDEALAADRWQFFFFVFLPGLLSVVAGHCRLCGLPPRTPGEIQALPADWREFYLKSKPGLLTESLIQYGPGASDDERFASEAWYAAAAGVRHDLTLAKRFLQILFLGRPHLADD
jgi:hypothetical protein